MPLVSVVVPTRNRAGFLAEALATIRAQTFTDYEIIVVSNGEDWDMRKRSKSVALLHDALWFSLEQGNVSRARNFGVEQSKGEWIAFLDDDDLWLPAKLERQVDEARRSGVDMIACGFVRFYQDGREIMATVPILDQSYTRALCHQKWGTFPSAVMVRKTAFNDVQGFDPGLRIGEDNDLWRRISWRHRIHQMDDVLVRYRTGHASLSNRRLQAHFYDLRHYLKMYSDTPPDLRWALPPKAKVMRKWFLRAAMPAWIRHPGKFFRLRRASQ